MTDVSDTRDAVIESLREQQRAIARVLGAVARSEGLQPVLDEVIRAATRLCSGEYGALYLLEGDLLRVFSQSGVMNEVWAYDRANPHRLDRSTLAGRTAVAGELVHLPDMLADPEYGYSGPRTGYRTGLGVPITVEGKLIGVMAVVRTVPEPFSEDEIELVTTFADQAAIAIANARLLDAVEQQLEQQRALGEVVQAIALSKGLDAVLQAVVDAAKRLCGGEYGSLHLLEAGVLPAVAHSGSFEQWEYDKDHPHALDNATIVGRAAIRRAPIHISDVLADPEYGYEGPRSGFRAGLGVPILLEDELIGVLGIVRRLPEPFGEDQIDLVKTFADQAAIAIANARLLDALERQLEQQRAIGDVLGAVARSEGLQPVLDEVVRTATVLCAGDYGGLYLAEADHLRAFSIFTSPTATGPVEEHAAYDRERRFPPDRTTLVGRVALTREIVHVPDLQADPEYSFPLLLGHNGGLGVPILIEGDLIGAIVVTRPGPFDEEQIELVKTFADQAAIAIANTRLLEAVERQKTELARFVSPQVADLLSSEDGEKMLAGHRGYVSILFADLRGFTAFTETAEPEELFEVLRDYHSMIGDLIPRYQGTLEHFQGDGMMVFFNDPLPVENHEQQAVRLALEAHERIAELAAGWRKRGIDLGLGIGIAAGYATVGRIGFEGRYDYGALGAVTNLASRLVAAAAPKQTLISQRVYAAVEDDVEAREVGQLELKGFNRPVVAYEVLGFRERD